MGDDEIETRRLTFPGQRADIRERATVAALGLLWRASNDSPPPGPLKECDEPPLRLSRRSLPSGACGMRRQRRPSPKVAPQPTATPAGGGGGGLASINALPAISPGGGHGGVGSSVSTYSLDINPNGSAGSASTRAERTACRHFTGVTQATDTPQSAPHVWQYVFTPNVAAVQRHVAQVQTAHTIFYSGRRFKGGVDTSRCSRSRVRRRPLVVGARCRRKRRAASSSTGAVRRRGRACSSATTARRSRAQTAPKRIEVLRAPAVRRPAFDDVIGRVVRVPGGQPAAEFASAFEPAARSRRLSGAQAVPTKPATLPNDPHANNVDQWYLFADGFPNAWSYTNGTGAKIAVIDTGVDLHNTDITENLVFKTGYQSRSATPRKTRTVMVPTSRHLRGDHERCARIRRRRV